MASMGTKNSSSHSKWTYDVFLSFRGDTRKKFTDHLYTALYKSGINTFRDAEKLCRGTSIAPELLNAIEESRVAIVVFSEDYASSGWCLKELAKIVECWEEKRLIVLPVFHYVDISDVRNQNGTFAKAFVKHEKLPKDSGEDVHTWRAALIKVADISGWDLANQNESKVIEDIVNKILAQLNSTYSIDYENLVGINSRMKEFKDLLGMGLDLDDIRFIGIWGMGGIGKTTLAQVVYDRFKHLFDGSSFLGHVREESGKHGLVHLQKKLLSNILDETNIDFPDVPWGSDAIKKRLCGKKVLVILDDMDQVDQLRALAGEQSWFGKGSRIIITTRNQRLLIAHGVAEAQIYEAKKLDHDEALRLFSRNAFKKDHPLEDYVELSERFINYAKGLPLALKVLGSSLCSKSPNLWESDLAKFNEKPPKDILAVLQISFDSLEEREKNIFLDIACFFEGACKVYVTHILQSLYEKPDGDIDVLLKKSLITISEEQVWMHDLLQELGTEIVRLESLEEVGGRSRLWRSEDILHVLKNSTETNSVKAIILDVYLKDAEYVFLRGKTRWEYWYGEVFSKIKDLRISSKIREEYLSAKAFPKMINLRVLIISNGKFLEGLNFLSNKLCYVNWYGYPSESLPTDFEPDKLVELHLRQSLIKKLWKGTKILEKLKLIDLSHSTNLIEIPDFSGVTNLEQLILQGCTELSKIHESLGNLKQLIRLDLKGCIGLKSLPDKINLECLEVLILSGCSRLKKFPDVGENMTRLLELYLDKTAIKELPLSVKHLSGLIKLDLSGSAIKECPNSLPKNLEVLNLEGCEGLSSKSLNELLCLLFLQTGNPARMHMFNRSLSRLCSLTELNLSNCGLLAIPDALGSLSSLRFLNLKGNNFVDLPESIVGLHNLSILVLEGCKKLRRLPELPLQITYIWASDCTSLETLALRPGEAFHPSICLHNCVKLMENQGYYCDMLMTILRQYVQASYPPDQVLLPGKSNQLLIPGREIPEWFSHRSEGGSMNLDVPSNLLINNICKGIAVCALFQFVTSDNCRIVWEIFVNGHLVCIDHHEFREFNQKTESNGLVLKYYPSSKFNYFLEGDVLQPVWRFEIRYTCRTNRGQGIFEDPDPESLAVTNCGAHLVYDENNIEYVNQTKASCVINQTASCDINQTMDLGKSRIFPDDMIEMLNKINRSSTYDELFEIFKEINRSRSDHDDWDGAEPSGEEGTSSDIDRPHPKNIQLPNLIQTKARDISYFLPYDFEIFNEIKRSRSDHDRDGVEPSGEEGTSSDIDIPHPKNIQLPNLIQRLMLCLGNWIGSLCA